MDALIGGGLFTALSAIIVAVVQVGNKHLARRLDRIEDKLDGHIQWHLTDCPVYRGGGTCEKS